VLGNLQSPSELADVAVGGETTKIASGGDRTCVVLKNGTLRCWGGSFAPRYALGPSSGTGDGATPEATPALDFGGPVADLALGQSHTCVILADESLRCWGANGLGQLGYGHTNAVSAAEAVSGGAVDVGGAVKQIVLGTDFTCALLTSGAVRCWGRSQFGQLGNGSPKSVVGDDELPSSVPAVPLGAKATRIAASPSHVCAVLEGGALRCWGDNASGELGLGQTSPIGDDETPDTIAPIELGGEAIDVACGHGFTCALLKGGDVRCFGENAEGQLGAGNTTNVGDDESPLTAGVVSVGEKAIRLVAGGGAHVCAILEGGGLRCWGENTFGQLGYPTTIYDPSTLATLGDISLLD
jgi:alpha-tubulin suppressor-like RCC1 family protein